MVRAVAGLFRIKSEEADYDTRGFTAVSPFARDHLEQVGRSFIFGYNTALGTDADVLASALSGVDREYIGFAFEGAAMAYAIRDVLTPWRPSQLAALGSGAGQKHIYMLHVGTGWALARLSFARRKLLGGLDPLLRCLAFDGCGFHQGYFRPQSTIQRRQIPRWLHGYETRAFDQGVGRSMWFVFGADIKRISTHIARFVETRRADLWSGVGLAAAYAGGADRNAVADLVDAAGAHRAALAQGVAFAAEARTRAENLVDHTHEICEIVWARSAVQVARIVRSGMPGPSATEECPPYELWRLNVQREFS